MLPCQMAQIPMSAFPIQATISQHRKLLDINVQALEHWTRKSQEAWETIRLAKNDTIYQYDYINLSSVRLLKVTLNKSMYFLFQII